ncbi:MAG TPA: sodium:proton antiporter NhaD [Chlamydiales bacterium]|jgi:NhaD family Na+/H+ antiporter
MLEPVFANLLLMIVFVIGYLAIALEAKIHVNKTASALLMAVLTWMVVFLIHGHNPTEDVTLLSGHLGEVCQIIFFLLGAMALVELIDAHKGFKVVTDMIHTSSKKKLLWILGFVTFFLSAILDNLTTTIVMISLLRKLVPDRQDRLLLGSMIVIAANAGGAWTPIGDVTTTMLWINGNITTLGVMKSLFFPSVAALVGSLAMLGKGLKGKYPQFIAKAHEERPAPGAKLILGLGVGGLVFVPLFKAFTGMPPFMGILIALGLLWLVTDLMHSSHKERESLRVPQILARVDISGVLFFLGILLCISALDSVGLLKGLADWIGGYVQNSTTIATLFGLISAIIDNVPLVAAGMGMYDLATYPVDHPFWQMLAYCAGTGGSMLVIGSAAGVAFMGLEKVDFIWYFKRVSLVALVGYFVGIGVYILQQTL